MTRSWWGWGNVQDAVTGAELDELLARLRMLVPDADLVRHDPPDIATLDLPAPRVRVPHSLAGLVTEDVEVRAGHTHGKALRDVLRNLKGQLTHAPDLVALPADEQDVIDLLDWASSHDVAVVPYGGGSSVVGGIEPRFEGRAGVVSLDLGRLDRVLEVDRTSRAARIQAGVLGPHLEDQLRDTGLTLRFFPQSFEFSTLGGWLATRAGGHYATGPTHIDDLVESMRVVTPVGVSESRRLPASGAGISPDRLFLGSEGTLGVITEAWMRLQERPVFRSRASVHFSSYSAAVAATRALAHSGLQPANCRLLDAVEAFLSAGATVGGGVLVLGFESSDHPTGTAMNRALELCAERGGTLPEPAVHARPGTGAGGAGASDTWKKSFIRMPYQRDAMARHGFLVETFETAVTWDRFESLHAAVLEAGRRAVAEATGGQPGLVTCRFTHVYPDGCAPYYGIYAPGSWDRIVEQWDSIKAAVSDAIHLNAGTITHHHAVGRDHRPWYDRQRPDVFAAALAGAKDALDPRRVMNPGVLLPAHDTGSS